MDPKSNRIHISIVSACRNESRAIRPFLDSLLAQDLDGFIWEAIIADGMSDDCTREVIDEYCARCPELRVIDNPGRIVSTGLNDAIRLARGEIVLRLDAHTTYAADYCRQCVEVLIHTGAANVGGAARTEVSGLVPRVIAAAYRSRFSTGGALFHNPDYEGWVDTVPYGCWRKSTLEQVGLFDECLIRNQDDELNLRLVRAGGRIWQSRQIRSWYSPRHSFSAVFHQFFQYGFWKVAVIRKHRMPGSWRHLIPAAFIVVNILLLLTTLLALLTKAQWLTADLLMWISVMGSYLTASFVASGVTARRSGWDTLPLLPLAFGAYHFSYGLGFVAGLLRFGLRQAWHIRSESVFARVTR